MKPARFAALLIFLCMGPTRSVFAGKAPEAVEVLRQAQARAASLQALSYRAQVFAEGGLADRVPRFYGQVVARRGPDDASHKVYAKGNKVLPGYTTGTAFEVATDGIDAYRINPEARTFTTGKNAASQLIEIGALFPPKFLHFAPFSPELNAADIAHEGIRLINGVECHVIEVAYDGDGRQKGRFCIGKDDHLLYRYERLIGGGMGMHPGASGSVIFSADGFDLDPKADDAFFRLACPKDYRTEGFGPTIGPNGLLAVGSEAPDWELRSLDGRNVSLRSLRGKIVVMDFWATWCGPCRMAMPGLQRLHQQYKDKPVLVYGINTRERTQVDIAAFMKPLGYSYGILLNGDRVADAYQVRGIPCLYVIDRDGRILHAVSGYDAQMDKRISQLIDRSLQN